MVVSDRQAAGEALGEAAEMLACALADRPQGSMWVPGWATCTPTALWWSVR